MRTAAATGLLLACIGCSSPVPSGRMRPGRMSPDLEPFLRSYFATWSEGDMRAYKEHFLAEAVITFVSGGEVRSSLPRDRFVALQAASRARAKVKPVERMTSFSADEDEHAATVVARWVLVKDVEGEQEVTRGVDRFTLVRDSRGRWRIAALVFYTIE